MAKEEAIEINIRFIKRYITKNNYVLGFFLFALFIFLVYLISIFKIKIGNLTNSFFIQAFYMLPSWFFISLILILIFSAFLAYHEKYFLMFIPILVWLLFSTAYIRTQNIPQLKDITTNDWTLGPDLDPFLYLRIAEDINNGNYQKIDYMRRAPLGVDNYANKKLMPWAIVGVFKISQIFGNDSLTYAAIIAPVIFTVLASIFFFLFVYVLFSFNFSKEKSALGAIIATSFYVFSVQMLHRTTAGIPEIESLGMVWFWLTFLFFSLAWKQDLKIKSGRKKIIFYALLSGLFAGAMSWSWGGYSYIYMIIAFSSLVAFIFNIDGKKNFTIFSSFALMAIIIEFLKTKSFLSILSNFIDIGFVFIVLLIMLFNFLLFDTKLKQIKILSKAKEKTKLPESVFSLALSFVLGILILFILKPAIINDLFSRLVERFFYPFGRARIGLTVAENKAPYFSEVLRSFGVLTWFFLLGTAISFYEATKHFYKNKGLLNLLFILFIVTLSLTRISPQHLLNGDNFISKFLYLGGSIFFVFVFLIFYVKSYIKKDQKTIEDFSRINFVFLILVSFSFFTIVSMRGAIRLFFIITPFVVLLSSYFFIQMLSYLKKTKDSLSKFFVYIVLLFVIFSFFNAFFIQAISTNEAAKSTVPSVYNQQWQRAMAWVRDNTPENSIFVHWWDYGYWIQTLGKRATVTDGGHADGWWDYTTARYLLTTKKPETALSLMKTHNVSYLLIDSSDIGKYTAFSSIGSDSTGKDRLSFIPVIPLDTRQVRESNNKTTLVYVGGNSLDEDIIYKLNETQVFLPSEKTFLAGIILEYSKIERGNLSEISFSQPIGIFVYNNKRYDIPIRYMYKDGEIFDFGSGINSLIKIIPGMYQSAQQVQMNPFGAVIYLSEKTKDTLFSQLYLLDDPNNLYPTIKIAHVEDDVVVKSLKQQGIYVGDFLYFQGLRGPIKIWKVEYPENILKREEFLYSPPGWNDLKGPWATLDDLKFTK
jgi:asparagine N-glycosylation enzyme membrane subunit Stt3